MSAVASREQAHAWELRGAWARSIEVVVRLDGDLASVPRVRGTVRRVAVTGAWVLIADGAEEPLHVPCALILSVRRPHFTEPLDALRPPEPPVIDGQLRWEF